MIAFPNQWHASKIKKFLVDIGNAQWVDSGIDNNQDAFELYEHLINRTKDNDGTPDSSVCKSLIT